MQKVMIICAGVWLVVSLGMIYPWFCNDNWPDDLYKQLLHCFGYAMPALLTFIMLIPAMLPTMKVIIICLIYIFCALCFTCVVFWYLEMEWEPVPFIMMLCVSFCGILMLMSKIETGPERFKKCISRLFD